jgi:hypothetical protein
MINQDCEEYKNWLAFLPGKQKTKGQLEDYDNPECRCCLGHACAANPTKVKRILENCIVYYTSFDDNSMNRTYANVTLPDSLNKILNIRTEGMFTDYGIDKAIDWLKQNEIVCPDDSICGLSSVNDNTEATPGQIAQLIAYLAEIEKEGGAECFV